MNDEQRRALVEEIEDAMHEYADVYERAMHGFTWNQKDVATAKNQAVGAILAAVAEAMLSEDVLEELNSAVELETINVHSGEFRVNAHEMMNAALNMAGLTEREE